MSANVLWVFERPDQRDRVKDALEQAGFEVRLADENLAALETFQRTRPDLVVIEVALPDTEKLELCQVLKATPQGTDTPVLVVTGSPDGMSFRAQAIHQYDADEFVYPFEPSRIAAACKRWLERVTTKPRKTPAPHQAALEDALDKLDTLLEEDEADSAGDAGSPAAGRPPAARSPQHTDPLRESLEELTRMSDELVDRLPIQAQEDTVEQTPPSGAPKDIAKLQQTLQELEEMVDDHDDAATSAEVEVRGDRGDDIQAHLDTMFERSEHRVDAPVRRPGDVDEPVELAEANGEEDGEELVTIESEESDDSIDADAPPPVRAAAPESNILDAISQELERQQEQEDQPEVPEEIEAEPPPAEIEPDAAVADPWFPSAIDPSLPRMGVPNEEPRRGRSTKWWTAAAGVALTVGAGMLWLLMSGGDGAVPATVADAGPARVHDAPYEPGRFEPREPDSATPGSLDEPIADAVEGIEPPATRDPVETDAEPVTPVGARRTPPRHGAAHDGPVDPVRPKEAAAPPAAPVVPAKARPAPEPRATAAEPAAREPEVVTRKPVATTTVALGPKPKPPARPPRETNRTLDEAAKRSSPAPARPVVPPAAERSRPVPAPVTEAAARKAPEPHRKEVREAPPFAGTEKTEAGTTEEGRPSDTLVAALEPPAPPPTPVATTPPPPVEASAVPTRPPAPQPVAEVEPEETAERAEPAYVPPKIASRAEPIYPARAHKAGVGGTVELDVLVDESGTPVRVVVKKGVGDAEIEAAAIHAVLRSSFDPARQRGSAVQAWTTATYVFEP